MKTIKTGFTTREAAEAWAKKLGLVVIFSAMRNGYVNLMVSS